MKIRLIVSHNTEFPVLCYRSIGKQRFWYFNCVHSWLTEGYLHKYERFVDDVEYL